MSLSARDNAIINQVTVEQATDGISFIQTQLTLLSWMHLVALICWSTSGILPLFTDGILHVFPICWEVLTLRLISESLGFGTQCINKEITQKIKFIWIILFVVAIGVVLNVLHFAFSVLEIVTCKTLLCTMDYWFLFVFLFILVFLFVLELFMIYFFWKYKRYLYLTEEKLKRLKQPNDKIIDKEWWRNGLYYMSWIQTVLIIIWYGFGYITTFSQGLFHVTPAGYELLLLKLASDSLTFVIVCEGIAKHIKLELKLTQSIIRLVSFCVAFGVAFNVTHGVFTVLEHNSCRTFLCLENAWVLIFLSVVLFTLAVLEVIMLVFYWYYIDFIGDIRTKYNKMKQP